MKLRIPFYRGPVVIELEARWVRQHQPPCRCGCPDPHYTHWPARKVDDAKRGV